MYKLQGTTILAIVAIFVSTISSQEVKPIFKAYQQFSSDFLTTNPQIYKGYASYRQTKATGLTPFSVGHLLAVLNEQSYWKFPLKDNFQIPLRLASNRVTDTYAEIEKVLQTRDRHTFTFSTIYTADQDLEVSEGLTKLGTQITQISEDWETNAPIIINAQIGIQAFGNIYGDGELVPFDGVLNTTRAVFVEALTYSDQWNARAEINNIGPHPFAADHLQSEFISYEGFIGYQSSKEFLSVAIPMKEGGKIFVLAQPKVRSINKITSTDLKMLVEQAPLGWASTMRTRVEFPAMNFSLYGSPMESLVKMTPKNTYCNTSPKEENFLQQISQRIYIRVDTDGVTAASATGVDLSMNSEFMEEPSETPTTADETDTYMKSPLYRKKQKAELNNMKHAYPKKDSSASNFNIPSSIRFDQPFFWYIHDEVLGPMYFGSVLSVRSHEDSLPQEQISAFETLDSRAHWSCEFASADVI